jgi:hypothetical protein
MRLKTPLIATALAVLSIAAWGAAPAAAAQPCWRAVINDWYKNGRVDGHYPVHCYSDAIANLPEDSKQYSSAPQDIRRDMLLAIRGDQPGGPGGPGTGGPGTGGTGTGAVSTGFGGVGVSAIGAGSSAGNKNKGAFGNFFDTFGPKNASSIPLPLIILAAVALLLLAAGGASFAARRVQARKVAVTPSDERRPPTP